MARQSWYWAILSVHADMAAAIAASAFASSVAGGSVARDVPAAMPPSVQEEFA